ncbi:hypothetical protein [Paractinoplanes rishiriensis]|uniref:PASTA domain-containing protein n=1 Tax=Paractinoplanes rishiriensis TaxID=1050105 RepID=A0A919K6X1_9ACTN|nr:hypothetical protein [Actinoplanes rishiriensis]GIF01189.1 hypothetical protein Ari01nite_86530 [Actinoplanes rishiriensis]
MLDMNRLLAGCSTLLMLAGCAASGDTDAGADSSAAASTPVLLQVRRGGGLAGTGPPIADVPAVTLYPDGRLVTPGPQILIYPPPALPSVQLQRIGAARAQDLAERAVAAGIRPDTDFGDPRIPDATTTWITVNNAGTPATVAIIGLQEADVDPDLTAAQQAAREEVKALVHELEGLPTAESLPRPVPYLPGTIAVLVRPHSPGSPDPASPAPVKAWPGPALPGSEPPGETWTGCVIAEGSDVERIRSAAEDAGTMTPWTSQGQTWQLRIRPLLPNESQCADLSM